MALFDQQPMGPIPARRPILQPPDPELEEAVDDPSTADVELVGPVPAELTGPTESVTQESPALRWSRFALVWVLLVLLGGGVVVGIIEFIPAALAGSIPETVALVLIAVLGAALVFAQRRAVTRRRS